MNEMKGTIRIDIDPRIVERENNTDQLRRAIHKAQIEQARLEGSVEQRAVWGEANYLRGYNQCAADVLGVITELFKGVRS